MKELKECLQQKEYCKKMISIVDYGKGNIQSLKNSLQFLGEKVSVTNNPKEILKAEKIVFPGVGEFGTSIKLLQKKKLDKALIQAIKQGTPFLGICLGLQTLFEESEESKGKGLGVFKGKNKRFSKPKKIPQIGWNKIQVKKSRLLKRLNGEFFYFVNSYYAVPEEKEIISCTSSYNGEEFVSGIEKENVFAFQFHPEKSGENGLKILKRFSEL